MDKQTGEIAFKLAHQLNVTVTIVSDSWLADSSWQTHRPLQPLFLSSVSLILWSCLLVEWSCLLCPPLRQTAKPNSIPKAGVFFMVVPYSLHSKKCSYSVVTKTLFYLLQSTGTIGTYVLCTVTSLTNLR